MAIFSPFVIHTTIKTRNILPGVNLHASKNTEIYPQDQQLHTDIQWPQGILTDLHKSEWEQNSLRQQSKVSFLHASIPLEITTNVFTF